MHSNSDLLIAANLVMELHSDASE